MFTWVYICYVAPTNTLSQEGQKGKLLWIYYSSIADHLVLLNPALLNPAAPPQPTISPGYLSTLVQTPVMFKSCQNFKCIASYNMVCRERDQGIDKTECWIHFPLFLRYITRSGPRLSVVCLQSCHFLLSSTSKQMLSRRTSDQACDPCRSRLLSWI